MPRALGKLVKLPGSEKLSRYHYYLRLPDLLMDAVERDPGSARAERLAQLAHSFAHDALNLAVLASRLLWYEALTADMSRSPDLVSVGTDAESFFLFLKAACDLLAEITVEVAVDAGMKGQVPSGSFDELARWVRDNPARIDPAFHFLARELEWFDELHGIRTNLAHRGYDILTYTDRVRFSFFTAPFGRTETRLLREERGLPARSDRHTLTPLLSFVKRLSQSMLRVADQIATASLGRLGLQAPSKTHALCGVYVPALHGLDAYEPPVASPRLKIIADCLQTCEEYLTANKIGFPDRYWWQFLIALSEHFGTCPAYIGRFGEGPRDVLVDWKIIFVLDGKRLGIVARDVMGTEKMWLEGAQKNLEEFASDAQLVRAVLVARRAIPPFANDGVRSAGFPVVVGDEALVAAREAFELLRN